MNWRRVRGIAVLAALLAAWIVSGRVAPVNDPGLARPAADRAAAISLAASLRSLETERVNPDCHSRLSLSANAGGNAPVIVLLHGFTNCPKQFDRLADSLARRGCSIVVPLLPRHGMADRMTEELGSLTAEELVQAGSRAVDVAHGLGHPIIVVGLSSSGILAAWLAQHRTDVDGAVLIAPSFAPRGMSEGIARRATNVLLALPNFFVWWDSKARADLPGPHQAYPRFASRALAQVYRLGSTVLRDADHAKPRAEKVVLVTSARDEGVNNELAESLMQKWRAHGATVMTYQFPDSLRVRHDMIDPEQPYQQTEVTYPVIEDWIAKVAGLADSRQSASSK